MDSRQWIMREQGGKGEHNMNTRLPQRRVCRKAACLITLLAVIGGGLACGKRAANAPEGVGGSAPIQSGGVTDDSYRQSPHLALGNPSKAGTDRSNYLILRKQYALSYNDEAGRPNWVSWHLQESDLGPVERGKFTPDTSLPDGFRQITPSDYTRSGYDRGHNCPSGDRTDTEEDNAATFLMSNIMPQAPGNNQGPWKQLEDYSRELTRDGNELYIVCGSAGETGKVIGRDGVSVPKFTWKVVVVLPRGKHAPQDIDTRTRVIAVRMPNISTIRNKDWRTFRVSVSEIEQATGLTFFTTVPKAVADQLKSQVDTQ